MTFMRVHVLGIKSLSTRCADARSTVATHAQGVGSHLRAPPPPFCDGLGCVVPCGAVADGPGAPENGIWGHFVLKMFFE